MDAAGLQQALFKQVKERLPQHLSLPEELASMLGISADSAYRRIRGEKPLDISELAMISNRFGISLDGLLGQQQGNFVFNGRFVGSGDLSFSEWLSSVLGQLELAAQGKEKTVFVFQAKDIPLFHHFQVPELALFKFFFWRRTILRDTQLQSSRFKLSDRDDELLALGRKIYLTYLRLPSTEIWNAESLNSTLRQIAFYRDSGTFEKEEEAQLLFDRLLDLLSHLEAQV
ncbi:MAG: helix-turn-helix domain-containing protein [Flavobacteriales bacterium]|nr:helix-turn-helix domain-containing protein [Flavobacteriales bacterium]